MKKRVEHPRTHIEERGLAEFDIRRICRKKVVERKTTSNLPNNIL